MNDNLNQKICGLLTLPKQRIPAIYDWLISEVWSDERFASLSTKDYLESGEKIVHTLEELIIYSAFGVYDELTALSLEPLNLLDIASNQKTAIVIFDGASLRELPLMKSAALNSGFNILECGCSIGSVPSDTVNFINQRIIGKQIGPSQLPSRKELKDKNISAFYYDSITRRYDLPAGENAFLLWSVFPDGTYMNFEARTADHFGTIVRQFDVVWKNIIMSIPKGYKIIITSDHGYVYLSAGFQSNNRGEEALRFLNQDRFRFYGDTETPPDASELQIIPSKSLALLRGRIFNRIQGPAASKIFRHGGLSLMEMLTPWLVLKKN